MRDLSDGRLVDGRLGQVGALHFPNLAFVRDEGSRGARRVVRQTKATVNARPGGTDKKVVQVWLVLSGVIEYALSKAAPGPFAYFSGGKDSMVRHLHDVARDVSVCAVMESASLRHRRHLGHRSTKVASVEAHNELGRV